MIASKIGYKRRLIIVGIDETRVKKLEKHKNRLQDFYDKLFSMQDDAEKYIQTIEDSKMRQILRYRYIDQKSWNEIACIMCIKPDGTLNEKITEDSVRKTHDRFFKKY